MFFAFICGPVSHNPAQFGVCESQSPGAYLEFLTLSNNHRPCPVLPTESCCSFSLRNKSLVCDLSECYDARCPASPTPRPHCARTAKMKEKQNLKPKKQQYAFLAPHCFRLIFFVVVCTHTHRNNVTTYAHTLLAHASAAASTAAAYGLPHFRAPVDQRPHSTSSCVDRCG